MRSSDGTSWSALGSTGVDDGSYEDLSAAPATAYWYRVRAFNAAGNSDWASSAPVVTPDGIASGMSRIDNDRYIPGLRRVFDLCLDATAALLGQADRLPGHLRSRHLALESAVIVALANRLVRELRARDPLADITALHRIDFVMKGGVIYKHGRRRV